MCPGDGPAAICLTERVVALRRLAQAHRYFQLARVALAFNANNLAVTPSLRAIALPRSCAAGSQCQAAFVEKLCSVPDSVPTTTDILLSFVVLQLPMNPSGRNGYECFDALIAQLRTEGHLDAADKLDHLLHKVAWTTGSELLGESGLAILTFEREAPAISSDLRQAIDSCMTLVRRSWPNIKR
jgi:hypothetical protein